MNSNLSSKSQKLQQKRKKLISDFFNFLSTAIVLLFINYMVGGYWWAMWPVGFYGLSILLSFLNFMRDTLTFDMEEEEEENLERNKRNFRGKNLSNEQNKNPTQPYQDALELEDIPRSKEKEILVQKKWDDRDMV